MRLRINGTEFSCGSLPPRSRDEARANASTARHLASFIHEYALANRSIHPASSLTNLNGKPLIVVTADEPAGRGRYSRAARDEGVRLLGA
jgi:hypothetical protein